MMSERNPNYVTPEEAETMKCHMSFNAVTPDDEHLFVSWPKVHGVAVGNRMALRRETGKEYTPLHNPRILREGATMMDLLFYIGTAVICISPLLFGIMITRKEKK